jgi:hypothetical protein
MRFTRITAMSRMAIDRLKSQCAGGIPVGEKAEVVIDVVNFTRYKIDFVERHRCVFFSDIALASLLTWLNRFG